MSMSKFEREKVKCWLGENKPRPCVSLSITQCWMKMLYRPARALKEKGYFDLFVFFLFIFFRVFL